MQLYEQGKLDLNKDICSYLPEGFLSKLNYDTPITMTNLMNHSAGFLTPYKEIETDDINAIKPLGQALKEVEPVQRYEPGKTVAYSNYGAALEGYIVECIGGMSYADYVKQNIFEKMSTAIPPALDGHGNQFSKIINNEMVILTTITTNNYFNNANFVTKIILLCSE